VNLVGKLRERLLDPRRTHPNDNLTSRPEHNRTSLTTSSDCAHPREGKGMKRPLSQAAFDPYVANPEGAAYLASHILEKRLLQLLRRIADGEQFTVSKAADLVFLPVEVFRHLWVAVLSTERAAMGKPPSGSAN
jgi:hypothetical protein